MRRHWIAIIAAICCSLAANVYATTDLELLKAARKGNVSAMRGIGMRMYRGCSRGNPTLGIMWLEKAVEHGDSEAMYFLGRIYATKKNHELSKIYLEKAANCGNAKAIAYLRKQENKERDRMVTMPNVKSSNPENKGKDGDNPSSTTSSNDVKPEKKTRRVDKIAKDESNSPVSHPKKAPGKNTSMPELHLIQQHSAQQQYTFPVRVPQKLHDRAAQMQEQTNDDSWEHNKIRQVGHIYDRTSNPPSEKKPAITDKPYTINPEKVDRALGAARAVLNDPRAGDSGFWGGNYSKRRDALLDQRASAQKIKDQLEPLMNDVTAKYKLSEADRIAYQKRLDDANDIIDRSNKTIRVLDNDSSFHNDVRQIGEFFSNIGSSISNGWKRMFSSDKYEGQF